MYSPWWKRFDWPLAVAALLLLAFGLTMLASATFGTGEPYFIHQSLFAVVSLIASVAIIILGYRWLIRWSPIWYGLTLALLILVVGFGAITRGASSWLAIGPFALQPSELAKLALILLMAFVVEQAWRRDWESWRLFAWMVGLAVPLIGLVLIQPDVGTASVLVVGWMACIWLSPFNRKVLVVLLASLVVVSLAGWLFMAPYQRDRLTTFMNPNAAPLGAGYNVLQSQIAVGSGQWLGRGWGRGTQSHLNFLPEHHNDFIFASLSEEFGFVGAMTVLALYGIIVWRGVRIAWMAKDRSTVIVASSLTLIVVWQATVNMAMNIGLAPVTGIPLPLVSYGGSSLLTTLLCLAVLESIALDNRSTVT